jgi:membrane-bound ClpP family serine protease
MGVKWFAWALVVLGLVLAVYGWQALNPVAFVGVALVAVGIALLATSGRRPRG